MDDELTVRTDIDGALSRRLEAYAEARLSPDLATSSRLRARVMAAAHRQAALARADASLSLLPPEADAADLASRAAERPVSGWRARRLLGAAALAAALLLAAVGTTLGARAGGPLYETRLWVETLTLPADPSERALAELTRLTRRLQEAADAGRAGDGGAAAAALGAYGSIVDEASTQAAMTGDVVAGAALDAGLERNITVLQALAGQAPDPASVAIGLAIERAIARSDAAVRAVRADHGDGDGGTNGNAGNGGGAGGNAGNGLGGDGSGGNGNGAGANPADATPRPPRGNGVKSSDAPTEPAAPAATHAPPTRGGGDGNGNGGGGTGGDQGGSTGGGQGGN